MPLVLRTIRCLMICAAIRASKHSCKKFSLRKNEGGQFFRRIKAAQEIIGLISIKSKTRRTGHSFVLAFLFFGFEDKRTNASSICRSGTKSKTAQCGGDRVAHSPIVSRA